MDTRTQRDIETLNRRFLLLIRQMASENHPLTIASIPKEAINAVNKMTLEEIDLIAQDMVAPCFNLNFDGPTLNRARNLQPGLKRKAYLANVLASQTKR